MKIAVMSFAHTHALGYVRLLQGMPDVELRASDPDHDQRPEGESGGASLAAELGIDYADGYDELLAWKPDAVLVCSENTKHRDDVLRAAAAGAHVLCEKPLATSGEDAAVMVQACEDAGVNLMVAFPVRFSPAFQALKERYDNGLLGNVYGVSGANNGKIPGDRAWFTDPALAGGGSLTDHVVHIADLLDALFGGARAARVYATANRFFGGEAPVETGGLVSVTYENGVSAVIDCSWSRPPSYPVWGGLTLHLVTDAGLVDVDPFAQRVEGFSEAARNTLWLDYGTNADKLMLEEFLTAIREGRRPQPDGQVGRRTVQVVEAAYRSVATGGIVETGVVAEASRDSARA
jgi:1,5-anhydro-D-fructose reductase (1,5-anhydro-D-mannitol-forming)